MGTFHAFCARVLREHGQRPGPPAQVHDLRRLGPAERGQVRHARAARARDDHAPVRGAGADVAGQEPHGDAGGASWPRAAGAATSSWARSGSATGSSSPARASLDFDDLLLETVRLLREHDDGARALPRSATATSWSTSTRTRTTRSTRSCSRSAASTATSAWWATTTSRSTAGAAPTSGRSWASTATSRAPRSSACRRTTARRGRSWTRPTRSSARTPSRHEKALESARGDGEPVRFARLKDETSEAQFVVERDAQAPAPGGGEAAGLRDPLPHPGPVPALRGRAARERAALRGGRAACRSSTARRCATSSPT